MKHTYRFYFYLDDNIIESKCYLDFTFDEAEIKAENYCIKKDYSYYISQANITNTDLK